MSKILCFDIDNVICKTQKKKYINAKPEKKAIKKINPAGIDLNSGVELSPGIKDKTKLKDCIKFIRESDDR